MGSGFSLFPEQASTIASRVDNLFLFIVAVTAFFAVLVSVLVIWFAAKYHTEDPLAIGESIHGSIPLELAWSIIPFLISIVIFAWAADVYFDLQRPPDQALEIYATAKRWMWKFQHLDGQNEINELHVPAGRPVKVTFTSEDVLHSMFFPSFRVKADAIPGRYSTVWFTATKLGEYHLFCAEYCGPKHSGMIRRGSPVDWEPAHCRNAGSSCSATSPATPVTAATIRGEGPRSSTSSARPRSWPMAPVLRSTKRTSANPF
jgi:cytochrome c oxidase subunit II